MYKFFEFSFAAGLAAGLSIEETIEQGDEIYASVIQSEKKNIQNCRM
jgi:hypothetical protein